MIRNGSGGGSVRGLCLLGAALAMWVCGACREHPVEPLRIANPTLGPLTVAVAPAMNVSGSADLDVDRVGDLMAGELSFAAGIDVIPVSRVLAVLTDQGRRHIESPTHALEVASILGADALLVFAVTEYDPYDPPVVGITAQLYGNTRHPRLAAFDPVRESRFGVPSQLVAEGGSGASQPIAQASRVYDASEAWVAEEIKRFAATRSADRSPLEWRKFVASQQHYLRFCCHATIRSMIGSDDVETGAPNGGAGDEKSSGRVR
ncbi:MAG: hypothetical protein HOP29_01275 [Phycisphaerales bacterium]|nr:hypothetical protein [Phycisphaerales bacterium]